MSKKKIRDTIVHRCRDEFGEIVVADSDGLRSLYFGDTVQSSIRLNQPDFLVDDYNRAMITALLFTNPESILLIGLGGCSLVHFLRTALPECRLHVVELRQKVIDLAYKFFLLSESDNLTIFHGAGQDFVTGNEEVLASYDLILVDAFDESGPAKALLNTEFLTACKARLDRDGILAINLWNGPGDNFASMYRTVQEAFGKETLQLLLYEKYQNAIVFGSNNPLQFRDLPSYRKRAGELKEKFHIDFPKYLKYLSWHYKK